MFNYNIINKPKINIDNSIIDKIFKTTHNLVNKTQKWTLNIVFLDDNSIQNLNKTYRNIDKKTDVLSFHYFDDFSNLKKIDIAWEVILSENFIKIQAKENSHSKEIEFYKLLIHSILHILWHDHINDDDYEIMQNLEDKIYNKVFD